MFGAVQILVLSKHSINPNPSRPTMQSSLYQHICPYFYLLHELSITSIFNMFADGLSHRADGSKATSHSVPDTINLPTVKQEGKLAEISVLSKSLSGSLMTNCSSCDQEQCSSIKLHTLNTKMFAHRRFHIFW